MGDTPALILASASAARVTMLKAAGVAFDVIAANIDEEATTARLGAGDHNVEAADVASTLAVEKALVVSAAHPKALVIGADQVLALRRRKFSKASSIKEARETLALLRGQTHELVSAVALAQNKAVLWQVIDYTQMTMRNFSDEFLEAYLEQNGSRLLRSVGCYEIEGFGVQLFEKIEGDYFTILGMPLLPLLAELRQRGMVAA